MQTKSIIKTVSPEFFIELFNILTIEERATDGNSNMRDFPTLILYHELINEREELIQERITFKVDMLKSEFTKLYDKLLNYERPLIEK